MMSFRNNNEIKFILVLLIFFQLFYIANKRLAFKTEIFKNSFLINTFLAASFGLLTGLVISFLIHKKPDPIYIVLGPLAGLVAITAACNSVNSLLAIIIGIIGSIIAIIVAKILDRFEIDDVVGAVPVHLAAGIWGTLAVGFFSDLEILGTGLTRFEQIKVQIIGIASIGAFSFIVSFILLKILKVLIL